MGIDRLPSGNYRARLSIGGQRYTATLPSRDDAETWVSMTRFRAATGELPARITVEQYATRWLEALETCADPDRDLHAGNLKRYILPRLGRCQLGEVIASDIILLTNGVARSASVETAGSVHATCAALLQAALAEGLRPRSPVSKRPARSGS